MGFDTYVDAADRTVVQYRKRMGDLGRFLFSRNELVVTPGKDGPNGRPDALAFEGTVGGARRVLASQGLGWHASIATYASIRSGHHAEAGMWGMYAAEAYELDPDPSIAEERIERLLAPQRTRTPEHDLRELGAVLAAQWLDTSQAVLLFDSLVYDEVPPTTSSVIFEAARSARNNDREPLPVSRAVETFVLFFRDAPLAAWPALMAVLLEHLPEDLPVRYVLTEGIDEFGLNDSAAAIRFVDSWWEETGEFLAGYAHKLGSIFGALAAFESKLAPQYWLGQASAALGHLDQLNADRKTSTHKERGDALERLVEVLINTESPELAVVTKNFRVPEEEIDLILRNDLPSPFWTAQNSPFVLVECKNWAKPIGVEPLRVLESKMEDRKSMARIGIFISAAGYTKPFGERLKAVQGRGVGIVFAITLDDLRGLIHRRERLSAWLAGPGAIRAFQTG
ncbi:restriction endonuclease [Frigoribacterium sp. CFBP 8766]|uniref:restriction endonuclease n=1 Tax=Frigoribacterium sp. CFBP 8766 TaxID=2775273 RepID=UPI00177C20A6|nr:restriction endonuclease [Frigoribacterium sp. CFBP 8766]MBD8586012.1 restriction endonuclease [Frigoribacterium sp. CFBP 8766]